MGIWNLELLLRETYIQDRPGRFFDIEFYAGYPVKTLFKWTDLDIFQICFKHSCVTFDLCPCVHGDICMMLFWLSSTELWMFLMMLVRKKILNMFTHAFLSDGWLSLCYAVLNFGFFLLHYIFMVAILFLVNPCYADEIADYSVFSWKWA